MSIPMKFFITIFWFAIALPFSYAEKPSPMPSFDTSKIEQLTGLKGKLNEKEKVFKITSPRTDINILVDKWQMPAFMGLTTWVSFTPGEKANLMAMGDLVLFEDEVNLILGVLLSHGYSITALHNHFFYDVPKVYFMHIAAEGSLEFLATGIQKVLVKIKEVRAAHKMPASGFGKESLPKTNTITGEDIEKIIGIAGQSTDGLYKVVVGRNVSMACGCNIGADMGVNTWAAFGGSDMNAVVDGDFAVLESELQDVLKSLNASKINIVAIHNHMNFESPRMLFLHYWGRGTAKNLAQAIKLALQFTSQTIPIASAHAQTRSVLHHQ